MDFDHLKTFVEVSRSRSFSRAAERLGVTQPSVSAQIQSLEGSLGSRLLERGGGKVTLTAAGRVFEPFAEECLARLNHIRLALGDLERSPRGTLTVSANDSTALYVLPVFFSRFKRQYSRVGLNIVRAERSSTIECVLNREVDFGIVSLPLKDARLRITLVHEDELILVGAPSHVLSSGKLTTLEEVAASSLLVPPKGRRREALNNLFHERNLHPHIAMEVDSSELLKRMVLADVGIGFLPRSNVNKELQERLLVEIPVEGLQLRRDLGLIYHRDSTLTRAGKAFYQVATGTPFPQG